MTQATEKDIGKWCKFYNSNGDIYDIGILSDVYKDTRNQVCYMNRFDSFPDHECKPLTQKELKTLGLKQ